MSLKPISLLVTFSLVMFVLSACNTDGPPPLNPSSNSTPGQNTPPINNSPNNKGQISLEVPTSPLVTWKDTNGKTTVIVQYSVRDGNGRPMSESKYDVELRLDDKPVDIESLLDQSAKELEVNLYLSMVLDASSSMTLGASPAFEPMKTAAKNSFQDAIDIWLTRPGEIKFSLIWFNEIINQSLYDANSMKAWAPNDILSIPPPGGGTATKLYSAVKAMSTHLQNEYNNDIFNGPRDQYVMLIFSDGADNYSFFNNANINQELSTPSGALYHQYGTAATTLEELKPLLESHPNLTVHVIGLGSDISKQELEQISEFGGGIFQENPSSENIDLLFDRVMNEFTTLQTRGAEIPLQAGQYTFSLNITDKETNDITEHSFQFKAGDYDAGVITN